MVCKKCGNKDFEYKKKNIHVGLYCKNCGKWAKWISKKKYEEELEGGEF